MFQSKFWDDYKWASRGWSLTPEENQCFFSSRLFFFAHFTHRSCAFNHPAFFHTLSIRGSSPNHSLHWNEIIKGVERKQTFPQDMAEGWETTADLKTSHFTGLQSRTGDGEEKRKKESQHLKSSTPGGKRHIRLFNISQIISTDCCDSYRKKSDQTDPHWCTDRYDALRSLMYLQDNY